ncbi:MAG: oligosaccharide flippase family protein [Erysipelotrichia bacterium]|jgi:O-antigen/teichoic acid export membrane protein|nr:oligosaccharide flippase family protein [Erysipelotrichia bacterium]
MNRRSLILSGLTSSLGIFITKAIGILYVSPFTQIAGQENTAFYSYGYTFYDFMLQLAIAGIPVAAATLISRYVAKNDLSMMLMVNRFMKRVLFIVGIISFVLIYIAAPWIVPFIIGFKASSASYDITLIVIRFVALAMFITPVLSSYRSFMQGMKEMRIYAFSQVLEQIIRVAFLLGVSVLFVNVFNFDRIYTVYVAMLAASVAGLVAIVDLFIKERRIIRSLNIDESETPQLHWGLFLREVFSISIPFLIVSVLSNLESMVTLFGFNSTMLALGVKEVDVNILFTIIMFTTKKLISIPHVLALGFSIAIIPYISESFTLNQKTNLRNHIYDAIETVLFIGLPMVTGLFVFSKEIYYLFYAEYAFVGGPVLQISSIQTLLSVVSPVLVNILIVLQLRRKVVFSLTMAFLVKLFIFVPLIYLIGYQGAVVSSIISHIMLVGYNLFTIGHTYGFNYSRVRSRLMLMLMATLSMALVGYAFIFFGWHSIIYDTRVMTFAKLIVSGGLSLITYGVITWFFGLPQMYILQRKHKHASN